MLDYPDEVAEALADHQVGRVVGLAQYQGAQVELQVDDSGSVSYRANGEIQSDAAVTVYGFGDSLVPKSRADFLAPYGQEVTLFRELLVRDQVWRIPLGLFRVTGWSNAFEDVLGVNPTTVVSEGLASAGTGLYSVPSSWSASATGLYPVGSLVPAGTGLYSLPSASVATVTQTPMVLSWSLDVDLSDRFRMLQRARLMDRKSPPVGATMYSEIRRLALMPVSTNPGIPDRSVPSEMVYENGRLGAIRDLADLAGAVPHMTRGGVLTLRQKDAWAEPSITPVFDISGTIEWGDGETDEFYNYVRVSDPNDQFVAYAVANDDSNPLSVNRAGQSDYEHVSSAYDSQAAADAGAVTVLQRVLNRRSRLVTVQCTPDAVLLELGDVGYFRDPKQGRSVLGEVSEIDIPNDVTRPVRVTVVVAEAS